MKTFAELNLAPPLQKSLEKLKFSNLTPIQEQVIPVSMQSRDMIACAETGSGKTGAYGIPIVEKLSADPKMQALILAPTRELVHQIADFMRELISFSNGIGVTALVGGADMRKQIQSLGKKPRIVVATPGRLIDHLKRRTFKLSGTELLVLDEGDRMLDMGFAPQLDEILKYLPLKRQTSLFTATLPPKVRKLADSYLSHPIQIQVGEASKPVAAIQQSAIPVANRDKDRLIIDELNKREGSIIIFTRTKQRTDMLADYLEEYGFEVDLIHGGRSQGQRNRAIDNFKKGRVRILCATDVAARGIDIPKVEHVINFDLPMMDEDYVHRIGRTGRNGASGQAVSFVSPDEMRTWRVLVKKYKIEGADLGSSGGTSESRGGGRRNSRSFSGGGSSTRWQRPERGERSKNRDRFEKNSEGGPSRAPARGNKSSSYEEAIELRQERSFSGDSCSMRAGVRSPAKSSAKREFSSELSDFSRGESKPFKKKEGFGGKKSFGNKKLLGEKSNDRPSKSGARGLSKKQEASASPRGSKSYSRY